MDEKAHPGVMEARPAAVEIHRLTDEDNRPRAMKAHPVDAVAPNGAIKAHLVDNEEWEGVPGDRG